MPKKISQSKILQVSKLLHEDYLRLSISEIVFYSKQLENDHGSGLLRLDRGNSLLRQLWDI